MTVSKTRTGVEDEYTDRLLKYYHDVNMSCKYQNFKNFAER